MKNISWRVLLGGLLVIFGALALLQSIGVVDYEGEWAGILFGLLFLAGGVIFMRVLFENRLANWWAAIPGMTLIGLGALMLLAGLNVKPDEILPAVFMGCIGAGFLIVYLLDRQRWWAIIPGGAVLSIAIMLLFTNTEPWPAVILFGGLAVSFGLVAITAQPPEHSRAWAWYPAVAMVALAFIVAATASPLPGVIWPILLIGAGLALVAWTFFAKRA